jgi:Cu(I)/Ag(I) efflux system membrane fusion protein
MSALLVLFISTMLMVDLASCKSKPKPEEGQSMKDMPGMDMKNMKGMEMKKSSDTATAPKLDIKVDDLIKPVNQTIISQVATFHPQLSKQKLMVTAKGKIEYDQRRFNNIATRVTGRIESSNVKFQFQSVKRGQMLFTIYSPELLTAQQDFVFLTNDESNKELIKVAREKLLLLGLSIEQVSEIQRTKKVLRTISIYAPATGYIITNSGKQSAPQMASTSASMGDGMSGSSSASSSVSVSSTNEPILREGQYVNKSETVFRVVNTEAVWAMLRIFPDDVSKVKIGNEVAIGLDGSEADKSQARIDFIEKYFSAEDKTFSARVYLNNQTSLYKIGDLISATIEAGDKEAMWVPRESVLDIGTSQVVFVKQGNTFKAKEVHTGLKNGKSIEVISGILPKGEIVSNAQYLIDSEAFIKTE